MKKRFIIFLFILLIIGISVFLWWKQALKPINPENTTPSTFNVTRGEDSRTIAEHLYKQGYIRSSLAFFVLSRFGGYGPKLQAGEFRLSPSMDLSAIADTLTKGTMDVWLTVPEGWRSEEIAVKLTKELLIPEKEFLAVAHEGYMFPETYLLPKDATAGAIADIMSKEFDTKVTEEIRNKAKTKGLSLNQLITIASLVEREARLPEDRPIVASVILNRLKEDMKLDIDATIQYVLGYQPKEKTWWKKDLTLEDLDIDSPYNTYKNPGLPPTPIANPGLAVIQAVVNAPSTNYLFYISDASGKIHPATSLEEHNANIARYLNK